MTEVGLLIVIACLSLLIIFLAIRCHQYKQAMVFWCTACSRIAEAGDTFDESLAIMSGIYHLDEDEIIRRLQA